VGIDEGFDVSLEGRDALVDAGPDLPGAFGDGVNLVANVVLLFNGRLDACKLASSAPFGIVLLKVAVLEARIARKAMSFFNCSVFRSSVVVFGDKWFKLPAKLDQPRIGIRAGGGERTDRLRAIDGDW
jgi:hypothetical protein